MERFQKLINITKINNREKLYLMYFIIYLVLSFKFLFLVWILMFAVWSFLVLYTSIKYNVENKGFWLIAFGYPTIEFITKYLIESNLIPYSWVWLNRLEHLFWAFSIFVLLSYFFKNYLKNRIKIWEIMVIVFLIVNFIGVLNELAEFFIRQYFHLEKSVYYKDTIFDQLMNIFGTGSFLLLDFLKRCRVFRS